MCCNTYLFIFSFLSWGDTLSFRGFKGVQGWLLVLNSGITSRRAKRTIQDARDIIWAGLVEGKHPTVFTIVLLPLVLISWKMSKFTKDIYKFTLPLGYRKCYNYHKEYIHMWMPKFFQIWKLEIYWNMSY